MRKIKDAGQHDSLLPFSTLLIWGILIAIAMAVGPSRSDAKQAFEPSISDWGGVGIIRTHNARFGPDGQLAFSASFINQYDHYSLNLQALSWLQGTFRYTRSDDIIFNPGRDTDTLVDRGADLKVRLLEEAKWRPAVALGFHDLLGTGVFSSEYLVASKRWYDIDFSLGIAWGYLGTRAGIANPMLNISEEFRGREGGGGTGGNFEILRFFSGERAAIFAGVEYLTPIPGLRMKLEYDGNDYSNERGGNTLLVDSPFNLGMDYSPRPWITFGAALERGNTVQTRAVLSTGLQDYFGTPKFDEPPPAVRIRDFSPPGEVLHGAGSMPLSFDAAAEVESLFFAFESRGLEVREIDLTNGQLAVTLDRKWPERKIAKEAASAVAKAGSLAFNTILVVEPDGVEPGNQLAVDVSHTIRMLPGAGEERGSSDYDVVRAMIANLEASNFKVDAVRIDGLVAAAHIENNEFRHPARAIGRAARVMANIAPPEVEYLEIVQTREGLPIQSTVLLRRDLENALVSRGSSEEVWSKAIIMPGTYPTAGAFYNPNRYPDFSWFATPKLRQHVGRPQAFYKYQIWAQLGAELEVAPGLVFQSAVGANIYNNFGDLSNVPASSLPHVRSEIVQYLQKGENNLVNLTGHYLFKLTPEMFGRLSGGYFEEMFAGYGGEFLYRPDNSRWAVGMEVHHAFQREFEQRFGLLQGEQKYDVVTGHLEVYWRTPFQNFDITASIGRYLAGDDGGTLSLSRSFAGGVQVGAWITVTDVSAEEFGEGSFDKGFSVSLPYDLFFPTSSRSSGTFAFRPLTRDGGQRLLVAKKLYGLTADGDVGLIVQDWDRFLD
jgi:hypothetical protein